MDFFTLSIDDFYTMNVMDFYTLPILAETALPGGGNVAAVLMDRAFGFGF